jgi:hypothetical protein
MGRAGGRKNFTREPVPGTPEGDDIGMSVRQDPAGSPIPGQTGNIINYPTVEQKPATPDGSFDEYRGMMAHGVPNDSATTNERGLAERGSALVVDRKTAPEVHTPRVLPAAIPVYLTTPAAGGRPLGKLSAVRVTVPPFGTADPTRLASRDYDRTKMLIMVESAAGVSNPVPSQPTVPATGVAAQNANAYPAQVVIAANGATITNVSVNGVTVGTAAGTYTVPAFGSISIAYTLATPTWVWSYAPGNAPVLLSTSGIRVDNQTSNLSAGNGALFRAGMAAYQPLENQQDELFAVSADATPMIVSVIFLFDELGAG